MCVVLFLVFVFCVVVVWFHPPGLEADISSGGCTLSIDTAVVVILHTEYKIAIFGRWILGGMCLKCL